MYLLCETSVEHPTSFVEGSQKKAELSNNISDRSEANRTGILSDLLLGERSEVRGKSAIYYIIVFNRKNVTKQLEVQERGTSACPESSSGG